MDSRRPPRLPVSARTFLPETLRSCFAWLSRSRSPASTAVATPPYAHADAIVMAPATSLSFSRAARGFARTQDTQDGFQDLLAALNPYVDELVCQPNFSRFMDLPIELRCNVYQQYFLDEKSSIACREWPHLKFTHPYVLSIRTKRNTAPFLPNLCLTNKALQGELLSCLLELALFEFDDCRALAYVIITSKRPALNVSSKVRKMTLNSVNGQRRRLIFNSEGDDVEKEALEFADKFNSLHSFVIPYLPRLRELNLTFHAPLLYSGKLWDRRILYPVLALSVEAYMRGFQLESILGLKELQKITITGTSGYCNRNNNVVRHNNTILDDGKPELLEAISGLCGQVKEGFRKQGREVLVKACLLYAQDGCSYETFK